MLRALVCCTTLLLAAAAAGGEEAAKAGEKELAGMSIVGNDEAPKSLVIVPWKTAALADALDVSRMLGDGAQPVDRDVFLRELDYYRIRSASRETGPAGAP